MKNLIEKIILASLVSFCFILPITANAGFIGATMGAITGFFGGGSGSGIKANTNLQVGQNNLKNAIQSNTKTSVEDQGTFIDDDSTPSNFNNNKAVHITHGTNSLTLISIVTIFFVFCGVFLFLCLRNKQKDNTYLRSEGARKDKIIKDLLDKK